MTGLPAPSPLTVLAFGHPLTEADLVEVARLAGVPVGRVAQLPVHLEASAPLAVQVREIVEGSGLTGVEWQTTPLVVDLPGFAPAAALVLAELHGRMGGFPTVMRRARTDGLVSGYQVVELVDLQQVREGARRARDSQAAASVPPAPERVPDDESGV